ncbi:uncharacterized protein LOC101456669 [Ceratitis capitata]|uniref:Single domain-containing protein n=1 Tax=Ceratitis capitata TaxID=7213 RepID=W8BPR5_CERCA|nr:uncharacterized protein LOC101456669 [Ceratitis capitata]
MSCGLKVLLLFAVLLCLSAGGQVFAWQALGNYLDVANPGKCTISETLIISPGEKVKSPEDCAEIHCDTAQGDATITGCGSIGAPDGCEWGDYVNVDAPFQECCARHLICDGGLNNETRLYQAHIWQMFSPHLSAAGLQGALDAKEQ